MKREEEERKKDRGKKNMNKYGEQCLQQQYEHGNDEPKHKTLYQTAHTT